MKKSILSLILITAFLCASVWCFAEEEEIISPQQSETEVAELTPENVYFDLQLNEDINKYEMLIDYLIAPRPYNERITDSNGIEQPKDRGILLRDIIESGAEWQQFAQGCRRWALQPSRRALRCRKGMHCRYRAAKTALALCSL